MGEERVGENFSHSSNCPGISGTVPDFLPYVIGPAKRCMFGFFYFL